MEVDLHTTISAGDEPVWESLNTIYYRGRFGEVDAPLPSSGPPPTPTPAVARWRLPDGVGWRLARMTGDYNGIHHWHWYARRFGFQRAFFHPQMIAGQCMAHLRGPAPDEPQQLKLWLKGPAHFGAGRLASRRRDRGELRVRPVSARRRATGHVGALDFRSHRGQAVRVADQVTVADRCDAA
jgi:hypothetical protein